MREGSGDGGSVPAGGLHESLRALGLADVPFDAHSATRRFVSMAPAAASSSETAPAPSSETVPASPSGQRLPMLSVDPRPVDAALDSDPDIVLLGVLGKGGMGTVHRAWQQSLERDVAVKIARPDGGLVAANALMGEAVLMGSLEHPNIVPVHALGVGPDGLPVLVMKRVVGVAWYDLVRDAAHPYWSRLETLSDDRLVAHLEVLVQVCNAVHFAHRHGVLHRDIKPENVMIGEYGEVYLCDWGIALRTGPDGCARTQGVAVAGTPGYLAPEMIGDGADSMDARSDVYLLGATLHCVVTGVPRHSGATLSLVVVAALRSEPYVYGDDVPTELATICNRATRANPSERYPTVLAFRQAVTDYLRHRASTALGATAAARLAEALGPLAAAETPDDRRRLHTLLTECRFGFAQALREWPDNPDARAGMGVCLERMFEVNLRNESEDAARTTLAEIGGERPDLAAKLDALGTRLEARRAAQDRLRQLERDQDLAVGAGSRTAFFSVVLVFGAVLAAVPHLQPGGPGQLTHDDLILYEGIVVAVLTAMIVLARRRLLQNSIGHRVVGAFVAIAVASLVNRVFAAQLETPVHAVLVNDMLLTAVSSAVGAMMVHRAMLGWVVLSLAGAAAGVALPEYVSDLQGGLMVVILVLAMRLRGGSGADTEAATEL